jgi:hypothetical protein
MAKTMFMMLLHTFRTIAPGAIRASQAKGSASASAPSAPISQCSPSAATSAGTPRRAIREGAPPEVFAGILEGVARPALEPREWHLLSQDLALAA